jgi:hypothetical protein
VVTTVDGIATFNDIILTVAGKYTFTVSDGALTKATSKAFTITPRLIPDPDPNHPGMLLSPKFTVANSTASTLVGKTIPTITVSEKDCYDNLITAVNGGTVTLYVLEGPQGIINGTLTGTFVKGVATFKKLSINTAGDYVIRVQVNATIPWTTPYDVTGTHNVMTTISPVINTMRAPSHARNYATGANIDLRANIGSLVASSGIAYAGGTVRLVTAGGVTLETGTVSATGAVNFHFNDLTPGNYNVYVVYDGDTNHTGAKSPLFQFTVGGTTTSLSISATTVHSGDTLTLTATARNALNNQVLTSGSIQFFEENNAVPIATVSISSLSTHTASYTFTPTAGDHKYRAVFVTNATFNTSESVLKLATVI